tara:strand:- start:999 stop:1397 length:399 start_codon:yes stop_codon:yes gene_type:complete
MTKEINKFEITVESEINENIEDLICKTENNLIIWENIERLPNGFGPSIWSEESRTAAVKNAKIYVFKSPKKPDHTIVLIELKEKSIYFQENKESIKIVQLLEKIDFQISRNEIFNCSEYQEYKEIMKNLGND